MKTLRQQTDKSVLNIKESFLLDQIYSPHLSSIPDEAVIMSQGYKTESGYDIYDEIFNYDCILLYK